MNLNAVRGRVYARRQGRGWTWYMEVTDGSKVVVTDNTGDWRVIYNQCALSTTAFRVVIGHGHKIRRSGGVMNDFRLALPMTALHSTNQREHWAVIARKRATMRALAQTAAARAMTPIAGRVHLTVTFSFPDNRGRDLDNYEIKGAIDGMVDAGVISDDKKQVLRSVTRVASDHLSPKGYAVLVFNLEEQP